MFWLQVVIVAFFFGFAGIILIAGFNSSTGPALALVSLFFLALGSLFLVNLIGFGSQHVTLRNDTISFCLAPLGNNFVFPWLLRRETLRWNEVRAVDVKTRNLGGPQKVYVLRTTKGDVAFFWPQWPDAETIAQEIVRRSGATTSAEDMEQPAVPDPSNSSGAPAVSTSEKMMRGCGTVTMILCAIMALLCVIALFGAEPEKRGSIARVFLFLAIAAAVGQGLRRYRKIR